MRALSRAVLRLVRWRLHGEPPPAKCVIIGAPHTSNWDFPMALLTLWSLSIPAKWVGKHTLFRRPFGWVMRGLGGISLDRDRTRDFVSQVVDWFEREPELALVIAPEGTRSKTEHWKSGFYWIAHGAGVPIILGYVDYGRRELGLGEQILPTGDIEADFVRIRAFYAEKTGRHPAKVGEIRPRSIPTPGT